MTAFLPSCDSTLTLGPTDLDSMPDALRAQHQAWVAARAVSCETTTALLESPTSTVLPRQRLDHPLGFSEHLPEHHDGREVWLSTLLTAIEQVLAEHTPATSLRSWLAAFNPRWPGRDPVAPIDLVVTAINGRRLDVLIEVLACPMLRPPQLMGGLDLAIAWPHGVLTIRNGPTALQGFVPSTLPLPSPNARWVGHEAERALRLLQHHQRLLAGYRIHSHTNVVGLAVMTGWREGLQAVLDVGFDPYAMSDITHRALLLSPLMLAVHHEDPAMAACLIQHRWFDPARKYGYTPAEWQQLNAPSRRAWVLEQMHKVGGVELDEVLSRSSMVQNDGVMDALVTAYNERPRLHKVLQEILDPTTHRILDHAVVRHTVQALPATSERERKRL